MCGWNPLARYGPFAGDRIQSLTSRVCRRGALGARYDNNPLVLCRALPHVSLPFLIGPLTNAQNDFVDKVRRWVKEVLIGALLSTQRVALVGPRDLDRIGQSLRM